MTNFYIDTEFIERPGYIQLISIGIIDETGKNKYYAISSEYDPSIASDWVKKNVIDKLESEEIIPRKTLAQIKKEVIDYIAYSANLRYFEEDNRFAREVKVLKSEERIEKERKEVKEGETFSVFDYDCSPVEDGDIKFWAYYADYDWVVFCWLFGTMMELPKGMPMYCRDLKQEVDILELPKQLFPSKRRLDIDSAEEWLEEETKKEEDKLILSQRFRGMEKDRWQQKQRLLKKYNSFLTDEHNAMFDAQWNRMLHKACTVYEAQKNSEKEMNEFEELAKEMEMALSKFQAYFNSMNKDEDKIELSLKLNESSVIDSEEGFIAKAGLALTFKQVGYPMVMLANKVFGFRSEVERNAKYDWGLKLYREMLYEITGSCIALAQMKEDARRELGNNIKG